MTNRKNAGWTTQDCPGSQAMVARPGDPMGFCTHCRKPILTNGTGRIRRHTISVRTDDDPRGRRRRALLEPVDDGTGGDDGDGEGWGSPEDIAAVVEYVQSLPAGVEPWGLSGDEGLPRAAGRGSTP